MQTTISVAVMLWLSEPSDAAVSVRDCTSCSNEIDYWKSRVNHPETSSVFTFGYQQGDIFSTRIYLQNIAVNVFPEVYIKHMLVSELRWTARGCDREICSAVRNSCDQVVCFEAEKTPAAAILDEGENIIKKKLQKSNEESFYRIRSVLSNAKIAIDVELFTRTGFCSLEHIVKGIDLSQPSEKTKRITYNEVCLRSHWCEIVVDLQNKCGGPSVVHETKKLMRTTTAATRTNTFKQNTFIPYVPSPTHTVVTSPHTSPHEDMETTTIKSTASDTNAQPATNTTNYVIMVNSSIAAAAVALLVIVAIRTRCWAKPDTHVQGTSQLSTNENNYKLRQNVSIRRDPEYEIIDSEYEAIDAEYEIIDTDENLYEEINL